jgi:hypothetical protein
MSAFALSTRSLDFGLRLATETAFGVAALAFGWMAGELWLSVTPVLWSVLVVLDAIGQSRFERSQDFADALGWPYLPRFAAGAAIGMIVIGYARIWERTVI